MFARKGKYLEICWTDPVGVTIMSTRNRAIGEEVWRSKTDKINLELFTLMYGSIVVQLCEDFANDYTKVNQQLDKMGYSIGLRLIEEALAKTQLRRCQNFRDTAEAVARVGFKMFLNVIPQVSNWSADNKQFSLIFAENSNPLAEFVELSDDQIAQKLWYSNVLCGVLRGALEMVQMSVETEFVSDQLHGAPVTEISVRLVRILEDEVPPGED